MGLLGMAPVHLLGMHHPQRAWTVGLRSFSLTVAGRNQERKGHHRRRLQRNRLGDTLNYLACSIRSELGRKGFQSVSLFIAGRDQEQRDHHRRRLQHQSALDVLTGMPVINTIRIPNKSILGALPR